MNSNYGKGSSGSMNSFNFDLGLGSNKPRSLNDQKNPPTSYSSSSYSYSASQPRPSWQPNKPSWTHQPAPTQTTRSEIANGPSSMVGDIFGKTWVSSSGSGSGIGIPSKDPNLFGDLVNSAIGQGKPSGNVPLKNAATSKSPYSMGNLADSLPKTGVQTNNGGNWGYNSKPGGSSGGYSGTAGINVKTNAGFNANSVKSSNPGGPSLKSMAGGGIGVGMSSNKDPFGSLVDFGLDSLSSGGKTSKANTSNDGSFGDFQNATKSSGYSTNGNSYTGSSAKQDDFGDFQSIPRPNTFQSCGFSSNSSTFKGSNEKTGDFGMGSTQSPSPNQSSASDPLGVFLSSVTAPAPASAASPEVDWGFGEEFGSGGADESGGGSTTELDGLPPPPSGVTASVAKTKGIDNKNQGQYADAIKWLSWAEILMAKSGDKNGTTEVLTCRAYCYKEVGEYKKAVADCTKVLQDDESNVSVLVQRALLYESMEKYKLGAEDLRAVLKIDPGNRIARSTVHRLTKMAD